MTTSFGLITLHISSSHRPRRFNDMHRLPFRAWSERQKLAIRLRLCSKNAWIERGLQIHGHVLKSGFTSDLMLNNDLINLYSKCQHMGTARRVFEQMPERNVVSWTSLMCGYVQNGAPTESLALFPEMRVLGFEPNEFTFSTNLKACGLLRDVETGAQIHCVSVKVGFQDKPEVGNSVIDMYSKCGWTNEAQRMFGSMNIKNLITWNTMIAGFTLAGCSEGSVLLFHRMFLERVNPDEFTLTSSLKACSGIGAVQEGKQIHCFLIRRGYLCSSSALIAGSLVDLYAKCGDLSQAHRVFDQVEEKGVISWSALILGYAQNGKLAEAVDLFSRLREMTSEVDAFVLSGLIGVFADFALVEQGKQVHAYTKKIPSGHETSVCNSIVDMYLKCGLIEEAERYFEGMEVKNVISWTIMITGYGKHGLGSRAMSLFHQMLSNGVEPDDVSYLAALSACSHSGLVEQGQELFFRLLHSRGIKPRVEHYACMVDLLGRAGRLKESKDLIESMPLKPNIGIWQTLLSACRVHGAVDLANEVGQILLRQDGQNPVNYVTISNIYAQTGDWEQREMIREMVKMKGLKKEAGQSWVEIDKVMHFFYGGEETHPLIDEIHEILKHVEIRMKQELGYTYSVKHALYDVEEESKEESLRGHSEKLAIGLALVHGGLDQEGKIVRVFKNLRVCVDCHEFIKGLSKILKIVFVVRDANRFHRFMDGQCSCKDYW